MSLDWNPFDPRPEATEIAVNAYWEARRKISNTNNLKTERIPTQQIHAALVEYVGLGTYQLDETRTYPLPPVTERVERKRKADQLRWAITNYRRANPGTFFATKSLEFSFEIRRTA